MELLTTNQYNQGIGKSKLLSSTAGVGSLITTQMGYYILVSDINKWEFVRISHRIVDEIRKEESDDSKRYDKAKVRIQNQGITFINDKRFVEFIKEEKQLSELICLVSIPSISLNEQFNSPNWKNHPVNKLLEGNCKAEDFMVKGTHFPKWFMNDKGELRPYSSWKNLWISKNLGAEKFVPPRDATKPIKDLNGNHKTIIQKSETHGTIHYPLYALLAQTNLILICPNGHLSDIPWSVFLKWKTEIQLGIRQRKTDNAEDLFDELQCIPCCPNPSLFWTESKTKSEGYSSIYIECIECGLGSGNDNQPKVNLEGINNLKPLCAGHKPWEIDLSQDGNMIIPSDNCYRKADRSLGREFMQIALVTGNSVYYASGFSSLFIPQYLAENKSAVLIEAKAKLDQKYDKYFKIRPNLTKKVFWEKLDKDDFIIENDFILNDQNAFILQLENDFLELSHDNETVDRHEMYRWSEYQCFCRNTNIDDPNGLKFNDIELPELLTTFFSKIQQIEELKVTQVQLDFTRVKPKERIKVGDEIIESTSGMNIFSIDKNELYVLPANETYGEGLFFKFHDEEIEKWVTEHSIMREKYKKYFSEPDLNSQGASTKQRIFNNKYKHLLIHTFSHLLMRELEFSCGYPTASLKERLYISDRMAGLLIYTAEGSEGSMGGLVWQGQPEKLKELIIAALERCIDCSSDPLCWESEGQGLFELNLAACFSCTLVSETACEEMNLGLDRRLLIDPDFGFFRSLIL